MLPKKLKIILIILFLTFFLLTISSCTGSNLNFLKDKNLKPYEITLYTFIDQFNNYKKYYINETIIPKISWIEYIENFTSLYGKGKIYKKIIDKRIEKNECAFLVNAKYGKNRCNILLYLVRDNEKWRVFFSKTKLLPQKIKTIKDAEDYRNQKNTEYGLKILSSDIKIDIKDDKFNNVNFNVTYNIFTGKRVRTINFILRSEMELEKIIINGENISYTVKEKYMDFNSDITPVNKINIDISKIKRGKNNILTINFKYSLLKDRYDSGGIVLGPRTNIYKNDKFLYIINAPTFPSFPNLVKIDDKNSNYNIKTDILISIPENLSIPLINYKVKTLNNYKIYEAHFEHMDFPFFSLVSGQFNKYEYKYNSNYKVILYFIKNIENYYNVYENQFKDEVKNMIFDILNSYENTTSVPLEKIDKFLAFVFLPTTDRMIYYRNNIIYLTSYVFPNNKYSKGILNQILGTEIGHIYFGKYLKTRDEEVVPFFTETGYLILYDLYYPKLCYPGFHKNFNVKNGWKKLKLYHNKSIISLQDYSKSDKNYILNLFYKGGMFFDFIYVYLGKDNFKKIMQAIEPYSYEGISIREFKIICEKISGKNLDGFFYDFIYSTNIPQNKYVSDDEINNCFLQGL